MTPATRPRSSAMQPRRWPATTLLWWMSNCRPGPARGCTAACASGEWLSPEGEPGAGKLALLRAVHRRRNPAGAFHVLDAADAGDHDWMVRALGELLEGEGSLIIRHVDCARPLRVAMGPDGCWRVRWRLAWRGPGGLGVPGCGTSLCPVDCAVFPCLAGWRLWLGAWMGA